MNPNRFFAVVVLTFAALPGLGAETVIDQLYGLRNYELADAYWAAGQKFADLGQADRGAEFKAKALRLYPGYVPGQGPAAAPLAAPSDTAPQVPVAAVVRENNLQGEKISRLQFQKLLRGYLTGSVPTVSAVLAPQVDFQGYTSIPTADSVASFLLAHPAEAGTPDDLFLTDTLDVKSASGQTVTVTVSTNPESASLASFIPFWKTTQVYTFDRIGDTWKLVKVEGK